MNTRPTSKYMPLSFCNTIKTFDNSTLYTTIPHSKLKDRLKELIQLCFIKKTNGQRRYKYLVLGRDRSYFAKKVTSLILPKSSLKLISSTCSILWLTAYLLCLMDLFFNRMSAYEYKLCSSSCRLIPLFVWGRLHTRASQEKRKETSSIL